MKRNLSAILAFGATAAAAIAAAALAPGHAYADDITVDPAPFVSTRARADVRAELMSQRQQVLAASGEWSMQQSTAVHPASDYTRAQARADFLAARPEVSAFTGEDSGSAYLARTARRGGSGSVVVGFAAR
jgi:hypothetical protein